MKMRVRQRWSKLAPPAGRDCESMFSAKLSDGFLSRISIDLLSFSAFEHKKRQV